MLMLAAPCPKTSPPVYYEWEIDRAEIKLHQKLGEGL
jgi:hypothetical protein